MGTINLYVKGQHFKVCSYIYFEYVIVCIKINILNCNAAGDAIR